MFRVLCSIFVVMLGASGCRGPHKTVRSCHGAICDDADPPDTMTSEMNTDGGLPTDMGNGSCQEDKDCQDGHWCERGTCLRCLDNGRCTTPHCARNDGCGENEICYYPPKVSYVDGYRLGYCVGPICGFPLDGNRFYRCNWSPDCQYGWACLSPYGWCIPSGIDGEEDITDGVVECNDPPCNCDEDCSPGRFCNSGSFCQKGTKGDDGIDLGGPGSPCDADDDCLPPLVCREVRDAKECVVVTPGYPCESNDDCCNGLTCQEGFCQPTPGSDGGAGEDGQPADGGLPSTDSGASDTTATTDTSGSDGGSPAGDYPDADEAPDASTPDAGTSDAQPPEHPGCTDDRDCSLDQTCQERTCVDAPSCETANIQGTHDGDCHGHYPADGVAAHFVRQAGHWRHCRCPRVNGPVTP